MANWRFLFEAPHQQDARWNDLLFGTPPPSAGWQTGLDPTLADKARQLEALAAEEGIPIRITTGYRSPAEQKRLYAQGRTTPGAIVTNARPGQSRHQHGAAIDIVPLTAAEQPDWDSPHWDRLGELGESLGLRWGGRFTRLKDRPHFELLTDTPSRQAAGRQRAAGAPRDWGQELFPPRPGATPTYTTQQLKEMIVQEARRQGVDPALALGIAQAESSFNPNATGDNGKSVGLFQLQPAAAQDVGLSPDERYDVAKNIRGGIAYYKNRLAREGGNEDRGISAYNQGVGWRNGQYSNPQYVATVRQYQRQFQAEGPAGDAPRPPDWGMTLFGTAVARESAPAGTGGQPAARMTPTNGGQALFTTPPPAPVSSTGHALDPGSSPGQAVIQGAPPPSTLSAPAPQTNWRQALFG